MGDECFEARRVRIIVFPQRRDEGKGIRHKMNHKKEKLLIGFKQSDDDCICCHILKLKAERLFAEYEPLQEHIARRKAEGKDIDKPLGHLLKTGNKLRAIKEAIREIEHAKQCLEKMIEVEINGKTFYRLNKNSDRKRSCAKKIPYDSEESAQVAAKEVFDRIGDSMDAYKCRHCKFWHTGHSIL